jgi:hypothetical protein
MKIITKIFAKRRWQMIFQQLRMKRMFKKRDVEGLIRVLVDNIEYVTVPFDAVRAIKCLKLDGITDDQKIVDLIVAYLRGKGNMVDSSPVEEAIRCLMAEPILQEGERAYTWLAQKSIDTLRAIIRRK